MDATVKLLFYNFNKTHCDGIVFTTVKAQINENKNISRKDDNPVPFSLCLGWVP